MQAQPVLDIMRFSPTSLRAAASRCFKNHHINNQVIVSDWFLQIEDKRSRACPLTAFNFASKLGALNETLTAHTSITSNNIQYASSAKRTTSNN